MNKDTKKFDNILKGYAIAQAVAAPALMVIGVVTNNKTLTKVGMIWCGLIALDTARTTIDAINVLNKCAEQKAFYEDELNFLMKEKIEA